MWMWQFLLQLCLNDSRLLAGEHTSPLVGSRGDYESLRVDPGSLGDGVIDMRGFLLALREGGAARLELLCRLEKAEWRDEGVDLLMLHAKPMEMVWALRHRFDRPPGWRSELVPADYPEATQWSLAECRRQLAAAVEQLSGTQNPGYPSIFEKAAGALVGVTTATQLPDRESADGSLRKGSPPDAFGLLAAIQHLRYVKISGMGGLDDDIDIDLASVDSLKVSLAQSVACLTRL